MKNVLLNITSKNFNEKRDIFLKVRPVNAILPESSYNASFRRTFAYGDLLNQGFKWEGHCLESQIEQCIRSYQIKGYEVRTADAFDDNGEKDYRQIAIFTKTK